MDGADASTTFTDSSYAGTNSPHTMTAVGNAQIDTAQSKFGGASGLFDGTGDYLTTPDSADWAFGSGAFTIDFWVRFNALPAASGNQMFAGQRVDDTHEWYIRLFNSAGTYQFVLLINDVWIENPASPGLSANTWYHLAWVRSGNSWYVFQDGIQLGVTVTDATAMPDVAASLYVGSRGGGGFPFNGWLDEFRVSKGLARWTANFTSPTRAYSYYANEFLGVADASLSAVSFGGSDILEANIRDIIYG
jgi:hypothetical protein